MRKQLERRAGRRKGGGVGRMPVDDGADVGPRPVDLRVEHGLEMHLRRIERVRIVEVEGDDVVGLRLAQSDAPPLDVDRRCSGNAAADVAEREVRISLECEDATRARDLLAKRLRDCYHS